MKIVIINGSPRTEGATAAVLRSMEKELLICGAEVDYYDLSLLTMSQCKGCCACYSTGHCHMNDDAEKLSHAISQADGLVLGSPTYASNVSGLMKLLIDRGHFVIEQLLTGKYCVTVATGENYGSRNTGRIINDLVLYSGGQLSHKIVLNVPFGSVRNDNKTVQKTGSQAANKLCRDISMQRKHLFQILLHRIIFAFGIRPFVRKKGKLYKGVVERWKEYGLISRSFSKYSTA